MKIFGPDGQKTPTRVRRKTFSVSQEKLVTLGHLPQGDSIPLVVRPAVEGVALADWAASNRDYVSDLLLQHRALLFRGFNINTADALDRVIQATSSGELLEYRDRSSPRHEVGDKIYTSTDYPAEQGIFLHNEGTYWMKWPRKLYFCCATAPAAGGETPIADCRRIYRRISPRVRSNFLDVMYVRNYNDGFGLSWETVFQTDDRAVVEEYCRRNRIEYQWKEGNRLRTRAVRPTVARHPQTDEPVWFNHAAFFHVTTLEPSIRDTLLAEFEEADLPYNTYYGDGSPIEPEVLEELREAYRQERILFPWQEGDLLLLDNMTVAHGRMPYSGPRRILAGLAEPIGREAC
ncbi:MAG: TauD/TfdA family dioxygenase [Pyrinomonadaceae bacterium]